MLWCQKLYWSQVKHNFLIRNPCSLVFLWILLHPLLEHRNDVFSLLSLEPWPHLITMTFQTWESILVITSVSCLRIHGCNASSSMNLHMSRHFQVLPNVIFPTKGTSSLLQIFLLFIRSCDSLNLSFPAKTKVKNIFGVLSFSMSFFTIQQWGYIFPRLPFAIHEEI